MVRAFKKRKIFLLSAIAILLIVNILFLLFFYIKSTQGERNDFSELKYFEGKHFNGKELDDYFTSLAQKKGAVYAFEVLKRIPFQPNVDMHLLGHVVGEILYIQKGAEGMQYCTQDFRNACSHTIVVGLFSDKGEAALPEIEKSCEKAPGGKGAYNMCFHGLGHGVLAFTGYDLPKTIALCEKTKTGKSGGREFPECVGGAIMEIISGGDHDKELWTKQSEFYLTTSDPLYPCTADFMPAEVRSQCFTYLTPHLFKFAGGNLSNPQPQDFEKSFPYCNVLKEEVYRQACYGGFGKEFVVFAKGRDIRNISNMTPEELKQTINWCSLADNEKGKTYCNISALASIYWGGENDVSAAIKFCKLLSSENIEKECFSNLTGMVKFYRVEKLKEYCQAIPPQYQKECSYE